MVVLDEVDVLTNTSGKQVPIPRFAEESPLIPVHVGLDRDDSGKFEARCPHGRRHATAQGHRSQPIVVDAPSSPGSAPFPAELVSRNDDSSLRYAPDWP